MCGQTRRGRNRGASFACGPNSLGCATVGCQHNPSYTEGVAIDAGVVDRLLQGEPGREDDGEGQQHVDRDQKPPESGATVFPRGIHFNQQCKEVGQEDNHTALWLFRQHEHVVRQDWNITVHRRVCIVVGTHHYGGHCNQYKSASVCLPLRVPTYIILCHFACFTFASRQRVARL